MLPQSVLSASRSTSSPATTIGTLPPLAAIALSGLLGASLRRDGARLAHSTFIGGSGVDGAHDGELDAAGNFYIDGFTDSTDFPTSRRAFQPDFGGGPTDAWAAKLNRTGTRLVYATYLGGGGEEDVFDLTTDRSGNAYIPGLTNSTDFPVTPGAFQTANAGGYDVFLVKVALGKRHKGGGQRTTSVTAHGGSSGPPAGLTRDRMARRR